MMSLWLSALAAILLVFLLAVSLKAYTTARELEQGSDLTIDKEVGAYLCPPEVAERIFSGADRQFVCTQNLKTLRRAFDRERQWLALLWVRQTVASVRRIMREHAQLARSSRDLETLTELKLFLQYGALLTVCGFLYAAIRVFGPFSMARLAFRAEELSRQIADAGRGLKGVHVSDIPTAS